jgi:HAD superfamily hydrolase (TIGR01509 family)
MKLSAVIFDLNGTILSDEDEYGRAFKKVLQRLGTKVNDDYPHQTGIGVEENWPILLKKYHIKTKKTYGELARETQDEYKKLLKSVEIRDGFEEFAKDLQISGIRIALATANNWSMVEVIFDRFDLEKYFDIITTAEEVHKNKPDPEIYLITADKLNLPNYECVVFDDSPAGVRAGKGAGMMVVGVARDEKHKSELKDADFMIMDYEEIMSKEILRNEKE